MAPASRDAVAHVIAIKVIGDIASEAAKKIVGLE
jgi:hypothetical protein